MSRRDENSIIEIKERTRDIMRKKGVQGKTIAEELNISAATVSKDINTNNPENIRTFFTADQLPALCDLLGCTVDYLLTGEESASSKKDMSVKDICKSLLILIECDAITISSVTISETIKTCDFDEITGSCSPEYTTGTENTYPCFYFSEYQQSKRSEIGNYIYEHKQINDFLRGVGNLRILLQKNQLDQELYNAAVAGLLLKIKD